MNKILAVAGLVASLMLSAQPVFAGWEEERAILLNQLESTHQLLMDMHNANPSLLPKPAPSKLPPITIPEVNVHKMPDPFAPPPLMPPPHTQLKQRCMTLAGQKTCFLGL